MWLNFDNNRLGYTIEKLPYMTIFEQWRQKLQITLGIRWTFRLPYEREIWTIGKTEAKTISPPGEVVLADYFVVKVTTLRGGEGTGRSDAYIHEVQAQKLLVSYDIASVCNHRIA